MTDSPWQYFTTKELACPCCGEMDMDPHFMSRLVQMRREVGISLPVTSGYRCPDYNLKISNSGLSGPHTTGHAVDINLWGVELTRILRALDDYGLIGKHHGGIGLKQTGDYHSRFIHIDDLTEEDHHPRPWVWTY